LLPPGDVIRGFDGRAWRMNAACVLANVAGRVIVRVRWSASMT
jgi:hypothetical protein